MWPQCRSTRARPWRRGMEKERVKGELLSALGDAGDRGDRSFVLLDGVLGQSPAAARSGQHLQWLVVLTAVIQLNADVQHAAQQERRPGRPEVPATGTSIRSASSRNAERTAWGFSSHGKWAASAILRRTMLGVRYSSRSQSVWVTIRSSAPLTMSVGRLRRHKRQGPGRAEVSWWRHRDRSRAIHVTRRCERGDLAEGRGRDAATDGDDSRRAECSTKLDNAVQGQSLGRARPGWGREDCGRKW